MTEHPITPPPHLIEQWMQDHSTKYALSRQVAQWGADQELDACCEWLGQEGWSGESRQLRAARRPKPPSLKEQALAALNEIEDRHAGPTIQEELIRRALEALPND
jgi:DNA-directed RNA polymerase subunit K/omega